MSSGKPAADPALPPREIHPAPAEGALGAASSARFLRLVSLRAAIFLAAVALPLGAVAGITYQGYASVHLRDRPKVPSCVLAARAWLRKPSMASGSEPRQTITGETVYLTPQEDRAVACAYLVEEQLARRLAGVLAVQDPATRAGELLKLVRDHVPQEPAQDRAALTAYMMSSAALRALPEETPEVRAASSEIELLQACRFDTRAPCPTRPPLPLVVWVAGVPAALGALALTCIGAVAGASRLTGWIRRRRRRA